MRLGESPNDLRYAELVQELAELRARVARLEANAKPQAGDAAEPADEHELDAGQTEYLIGAHVLPRIGAGLIVLAMVILAVLGSAIPAPALFGGELVFCVAFVAIGEWKRNELEGFGQVLTAIGSTGAYFAVAAACFGRNYLTVSALAVAFAALTLAHFAYALWRKSAAFLVIGTVGGLVGAALAFQRGFFVAGEATYVATAIVGAFVAARSAWPHVAFSQWLLAIVAVMPLQAQPGMESSVIAIGYLATLASVAAMGHAFAGAKLEGRAAAAPIILFLTGAAGYGLIHGQAGAIHLLALSTAGFVAGLSVPKDSPARIAILFGAIATAAVLTPWCFGPAAAAVIFPILSVGGWMFGRRARPKLAAAFSLLTLLLGVVAYSAGLDGGDMSLEMEIAVLAALAVGVVGAALAERTTGRNGIAVAVLGCFAWVTQATHVVLLRAASTAVWPITIAWIALALVLLTVGFGLRSPALRFWSFGAMFAAVLKMLMVDLRSADVSFRVAGLLLLGLLMLLGGYAYVRGRATAGTTDAPGDGETADPVPV